MTLSRAAIAALALACALFLSPGIYAAKKPIDVVAAEVVGLIQQGKEALDADKSADALEFLEQAITTPGFGETEPAIQYFAYLLGSFAAAGAEDTAKMHEFLVAASRFPDADADVWTRRAQSEVLLGKPEDAAQSLMTVARKWPKELKGDDYHNWLVNKIVRDLGKQPGLQKTRVDLVNTLFDAEYRTLYGREPSHLWLIAATDAIDHKDMKRAKDVTRRITHSSTLVAMRIDKRFDALTSSEPKLFDVQAAAVREVIQAKKAMNENPKALGAVVMFGYALYTVGQFEEMLALTDSIIAKVDKAKPKEPLYEDLDDQLNWIYNHKASALRALGRFDEAAAALQAWNDSQRNAGDRVSQAINLGFFYNEMGRPDDALKAVAGIDASKGMSEYGRTQYEFVRFQAFEQQKKASEAEAIVAWMREHKDDSPDTAQDTLMEAGDVDGAAALMISRLNDPDERADALAGIQRYAQSPRTERLKELDALNEAMLARPDVVAAIAKYGRRETFSIYSLDF
jgi:tetratricopeptide (TPR) repeat protein